MKKLFTVMMAFLVMLFFNGCSNAPDKQSNKVLDDIKKRGKLVAGTEASFAPFEFVQDGKIVGYGPDILKEIGTNLGVEVEQIDTPFASILLNLEAKKYDFVATAVSVTPERQKNFALTTPIGDYSLVLVKQKANSAINSLDDLDGKVIGCTIGTVVEKQLKAYNEQLQAQGKQGFELKAYQSNADSHFDLENGRLDVLMGAKAVINSYMKDNPASTFEIFATFGKANYFSWVFRKEDKEFYDLINGEILKLKKSGKLGELQEKWFGTTWDLPDQLPVE